MPQNKQIHDNTSFSHLSIKDLVEARDTFHVHLMNKKNVIATAIGRYLFRKSDFNSKGEYVPVQTYPRPRRTLDDSIVTDFSWPCVLVLVKKWEDELALINDGGNNIVPKCIFMPDGKVVPICVVESARSDISNSIVNEGDLKFPKNMISGGFPLIVETQGERRIASVGCLVSDGNKVYALTNRHVTGKEGTEIFSRLNTAETRIGVTSSKQLGKSKFIDLYPGFVGNNLVVNNDVGLIEVDDLNMWKTEVFGFGQLNELKDLNTFNLSLNLITKKVFAFGAVSHELQGEIMGMFYRYKSVGGIEYIADFLIAGANGRDLNAHHGDSGTLWLIEDEDDNKGKILRPFALHWGQHEFLEGAKKKKRTYALATSLSNICRELDVDLLRGWNIDQDYSWGKRGHFKIGSRACDLVSDASLEKLLQANKFNIGYSDEDLSRPGNLVKAGSGEFTPLADVADLVWRPMKGNQGVSRGSDESNHFADMDDKHRSVLDNQSLLDLCFEEDGSVNESFVDKDKWLDFYRELDEVKPEFDKNGNQRRRLGALPFRVWQMYDIMVEVLKKGKIDEFICAGGTMSHYVGDACQCLHISAKHHGIKPEDSKVHGDYEDRMLTNSKNGKELFAGINSFAGKVDNDDLFEGGKGAAIIVLQLMKNTFDNLSPDTVIKEWRKSAGDMEKLWSKVKGPTIENINNGSLTMATVWQSAWVEGRGADIPDDELVKVDKDRLMELYNDRSFVPSFPLDKLKLKVEEPVGG